MILFLKLDRFLSDLFPENNKSLSRQSSVCLMLLLPLFHVCVRVSVHVCFCARVSVAAAQ